MLVVIPVRAGSKRIPNKWRRPLGGKPLLQWAIDRAKVAGYRPMVASESAEILTYASEHGADTFVRDAATARDASPDWAWAWTLAESYAMRDHESLAIVRITSPFLPLTHLEVMDELRRDRHYTSVRCVRRVREHPCKMWTRDEDGVGHVVKGGFLGDKPEYPYHSCPTQVLPEVFVQTAGAEVTAPWVLRTSLAGSRVGLYVVSGIEALDLNTPEDWAEAERIVGEGRE